MRKLLLLPALASLLFLAPGSWADDKAATDIQGRWTITAGENEGQPVSADKLTGNRVVITADTIAALDKEQQKLYVATYKLDRSKQPMAISMMVAEGKDKGKKAEGIIAVKGDELRLAYSLEGAAPKDFGPSDKSNGHQLSFTLKRVPVDAK